MQHPPRHRTVCFAIHWELSPSEPVPVSESAYRWLSERKQTFEIFGDLTLAGQENQLTIRDRELLEPILLKPGFKSVQERSNHEESSHGTRKAASRLNDRLTKGLTKKRVVSCRDRGPTSIVSLEISSASYVFLLNSSACAHLSNKTGRRIVLDETADILRLEGVVKPDLSLIQVRTAAIHSETIDLDVCISITNPTDNEVFVDAACLTSDGLNVKSCGYFPITNPPRAKTMWLFDQSVKVEQTRIETDFHKPNYGRLRLAANTDLEPRWLRFLSVPKQSNNIWLELLRAERVQLSAQLSQERINLPLLSVGVCSSLSTLVH